MDETTQPSCSMQASMPIPLRRRDSHASRQMHQADRGTR